MSSRVVRIEVAPGLINPATKDQDMHMLAALLFACAASWLAVQQECIRQGFKQQNGGWDSLHNTLPSITGTPHQLPDVCFVNAHHKVFIRQGISCKCTSTSWTTIHQAARSLTRDQ